MDRQQNAAVLDATFIPLCFVLWNSEPDERADKAADSTADAETCECPHDGACCNERTNARNGQRAKASHQSKCPANCTTHAYARGRALRRLGVLLRGECLGTLTVCHQDRDVLL